MFKGLHLGGIHLPTHPPMSLMVASHSNLNLYLFSFFRIEGATKAMEGIFAVSNLKIGEDYSAFTLSCESKFPDKMPYAVTLYTPGGDIITCIGLDLI